MLEVKDLSVAYGKIVAVKSLSLEVHEGEIVTLLGSNGAGKSTTLRAISGLLPPRSGSISFEGQSLVGVPGHEVVGRGICHSPEGRRIFGNMTVDENLALGAFLRNDHAAITADRDHVLDLFPRLKERINQKAGTMSGGEQQMLAVARALMGRPRLLLLDEPSMGLAPNLVEEVFQKIVQINKDGVTVLLVEQNANRALEIAHRGYVIKTGTVELSGNAADLSTNAEVEKLYLS
jgi:branched-chain amino acid transport system ATP-binding protein